MHAQALLLVGAVAGVGVLHTVMPDHWVPITLMARERGWSPAGTARAAFQAGAGHVLSTLAIGVLAWIAGAAFARRFGALVDLAAGAALIAFGFWFMVAGWREIHRGPGPHDHGETRAHGHESGRTSLLLILGSSPMVEGIPAFFAAARYGFALIVLMGLVFAASTIATYVLLCVSSAVGLGRVRLGVLERYGEVLSGSLIVLVGVAFALLSALDQYGF
ncbi:MAG TPA: hypothetical protein VMA37_18025 [Acetobacteraceae bacterium]|nr:hypothetical protein [Acetobacteraceae bacterium]